ncbi:unnamed protein product [Penicillium salamii]|nr:unnamed protein product [Penicillium salamii]CAG7948163.1 unnamed protein product [Penicillium salamii]CAG8239498.1 unnamed protein product [Penicillium salamii]
MVFEAIGGPDPKRNSQVKFIRRSQTLKVKAHELAKLCGANVYLVINYQRGSFVYNSVDDRSWPPNNKKLVSKTMPEISSIKLRDWQEQQYPDMERSDFSQMESLQESSEGDLCRLTRYYAARSEQFRLLEDLYRDKDPANVVADEEAFRAMSRPHDQDVCFDENVSVISD